MSKGLAPSRALVLWGCVLIALLSAGAMARQDEPVEEPPVLAEGGLTPEKREELRGKLFFLAEMISMRSRYSPMNSSNVDAVADALEQYAQSQEVERTSFEGYPSLQTAYRDVRAFLVGSRGAIIPAMRMMPVPVIIPDPAEYPELAVVSVLISMSLEIAKHGAIRDWCEEYDIKCRRSYERIMPLVRLAATGEPWPDPIISIKNGFTRQEWVYLEATNVSGRDLDNVTLALKLETIDGTSSKHFYFIPRWLGSPGEEGGQSETGAHGPRYFIRIATDWLPIGAAATTRVTAEVVSDVFVARNLHFDIDDHIPTAADRALAIAERNLNTKQKPKLVIDAVQRIRPRLSAYADRASRADAIARAARAELNRHIERIDAEVDGLLDEITALQQKARDTDQSEPRDAKRKREAEAKKEIAERRSRVEALRRERAEWLSGKR